MPAVNMRRSGLNAGRRCERGAATLIVVMVLFFIIAMVAGYTGRNLIFEQRTSANQYRSTLAFEAAEAGIHWTMAMLNGGQVDQGRIDEQCLPTTDLTKSSFRARYLDTIDAKGNITVRSQTSGDPLLPTCVYDATSNGWQCLCPSDTGAAIPTVTAGNAARPMFRIRIESLPLPPTGGTVRADVVRIVSVGCTRPDAKCILPEAGSAPGPDPSKVVQAPDGDGIAVLTAMVTLRGGLAALPAAPITARGNVSWSSSPAALQVINNVVTNNASGGLTVNSGGDVTGNVVSVSFPGIPGSQSQSRNDSLLSGIAAVGSLTVGDRMLSVILGAKPGLYAQQPGLVQMDCTGGCASAAVNQMAQRNPGRVLWLNGDLLVNGNIGADPGATLPTLLASELPPAAPVMLVVNGNTTLASGTVYGAVYCRAATCDLGAGSGQIVGALMAEKDLTGSGTQTITYRADILAQLRTRHGSFVRVPSGWRDFDQP